MGLIERTIELVIAIFIVVVFAVAVFPALGEATNQDVTWIIVILILTIAVMIYAFFKSILR